MAQIDNGLMTFLAEYPEGHVDITSDSLWTQLVDRFQHTSFVDTWREKIEQADSLERKRTIAESLKEMWKFAEKQQDLGTVIPVLTILTDDIFCRAHGIKPTEISQRNLTIAKVLLQLDRGDLAEKFIPGISERAGNDTDFN